MSTNILVICHGAINRSPLAGHLLMQMRPDLKVQIAGVRDDAGGERATAKLRGYVEERIEQCRMHGDTSLAIDYQEIRPRLADYRSQRISEDLLLWAQRVVLMDKGNLRRLIAFIEQSGDLGHVKRNLADDMLSWRGKPVISLGKWHSPPLPSLRDPGFIARSSPDLYKAFRAVEDATRNLANGPELRKKNRA